jgi:hypothetical protein
MRGSAMTELTSEAIHEIAKRVLFKPDEIADGKPPENAVRVEGLVNRFAFHPDRVMEAKPQIDALLLELPDSFHQSKGGGWTFLNAFEDRHGRHWGEHRDMEMLVCLGIAVGSASWMLREMMEALPGGVPYFEIHPGTVS